MSHTPSAIDDMPVLGLILAGGQGSRYGGRDKAWLSFAGRPLLCHAAERLSPQVNELAVSANRHRWAVHRLGGRTVPDAAAWSGRGPLAAIASALQACPGMLLAIVPVDCPRAPRDHVARLHASLKHTGAVAAALHDTTRRQPLFALLSPGVLPDALAALRCDRTPSMRDWLDGISAEWVEYRDPDGLTFANINRPDDLRALEAACAHD